MNTKTIFRKKHQKGIFIQFSLLILCTTLCAILLKWVWNEFAVVTFDVGDIQFMHAFGIVLLLRLLYYKPFGRTRHSNSETAK